MHRDPAAPATALVLLALGLTGCERDAGHAGADAVQMPYSGLSAEYPAEFRAGKHILSGGLIARGDSLYHGAVGQANCIVCHGPFLKGGSRGTNLRDREWHHGDGSYEFLVAVSGEGVAEAVQSPIPSMPPMGGIALSGEQIQALAAYIYWFSSTRAASDEVSYP